MRVPVEGHLGDIEFASFGERESFAVAMGSYEAIEWARNIEGLTLAQGAILLALATRADEDNSCFPSYSRIAKDVCTTRKTAILTVRELEAADLIEVSSQSRASGGRSSNRYRILIPADWGSE